MSREAKLVVDQLIHDLQHRAEDFKCGEHTLDDSKTGYRYWVANLFFDARIYQPYEMSFGVVQGWRFHRALRKWKAWKMIALSGEATA